MLKDLLKIRIDFKKLNLKGVLELTNLFIKQYAPDEVSSEAYFLSYAISSS
jgi:hypothetical protein